MVPLKSINDFFAQKKLAVIGVSRDTRKFSYQAYKTLKTRGYEVYPVNPYAEKIGDDKCYPDIKSLPQPVTGALMMLSPERTIHALPEIVKAGIKNVWLQQKTDSPQAIQFCADNKINLVYGQCVMMFAEPVGFIHRIHRWSKKVTGNLPE